METLPHDIRNLPAYTVPKELFVCTSVILILLLLGGITLIVVWIIRSSKHIYNYEYIPFHEFKFYREKKIENLKVDDEEVLNEEGFTESQ